MQIALLLVLPWLLYAGAAFLLFRHRQRLGWELATFGAVTLALVALGCSFFAFMNPDAFPDIPLVGGSFLLTLVLIALFLAAVEYGLMPVLGQFRLGAIARVTYYEALLQPFTIMVLCAGIGAMSIMSRLSFFTYYEDFKMYRDVATSFVFLFTLPIMIFASTKVVDEEIENRTMLTLMSKPVSRWQVILGKYLGVLVLVLVCVVALGAVAALTSYLRYFDDMSIDFRLARNAQEWNDLHYVNLKHLMALLPGLVLAFLQVATLAAISVAVSTRYGLAVNVTVVVLIYIAASMAQFMQMARDVPAALAVFNNILAYILPSLGLLDINQRLVFGTYILGANDNTVPIDAEDIPTYGAIWQYVGLSSVYALFYIGAALSMGMALFRSRELT